MFAVPVTMASDGKGGRSEYSNSVDSGAVAPAARLDTSMTWGFPDSTTGGRQRTGVRPVDTARKRP